MVTRSVIAAPGHLAVQSRLSARASNFAELAKWLAFGLMLWNHINLYVLGLPDVKAAWFLGGLVFPLFALSFGMVLADRSFMDIRRIASRLFVATVVCYPLQLLVRDPLPVNVLLTFSMAAFAYADYREHGFTWSIIAYAVISSIGEYSVVGFGLLFFTLVAFRTRDLVPALVAASLVLPLSIFLKLQFGQFLLLAVVPLLWFLPVRVPRVRNWFLAAYVVQYPILAVASHVW